METLSPVKAKFKCLLPVLPSPTIFSFCHLNALAVWEWKFLVQQPEVTSEMKTKAKFCVKRKDMTSCVKINFRSRMIIRLINVIITLQMIPSAIPGLYFLEAKSFQKKNLLPSSWKRLDLPSSTQGWALLRHLEHLKLYLRQCRDL